MSLPNEFAIRARALTKRYRATTALDRLDLDVGPGVVFGFLGPNGAGKTTTIRLLMGFLRPTSGSAEVFGLDARKDRRAIHRLAGYLPGEFTAYRDLTGERYLRYIADLRGGVEPSRIARLAERLNVDPTVRIGSLSHGNRQKIGVIQAFMHRPRLLVLDEPTIGLDPLMQREFVAMLREARDDGATTFLSSHILDEVEAVADVVGIVRDGRLLVVDRVDVLKQKARRKITLRFDRLPPPGLLQNAPGVSEVVEDGDFVAVTVAGSTAALMSAAAPFGIRSVVGGEADFEEIFLAYYAEEG